MAKPIQMNHISNAARHDGADLRPRLIKKVHEREMWDWHGDVYTRDEAEVDHYLLSEEYLSSWDCEVCHWQEFTGEYERHHHAFD